MESILLLNFMPTIIFLHCHVEVPFNFDQYIYNFEYENGLLFKIIKEAPERVDHFLILPFCDKVVHLQRYKNVP